MEQKRWTPEDEMALEEEIRDAPRRMRELLLIRKAQERERRERAARRRRLLNRASFGLLGRG